MASDKRHGRDDRNNRGASDPRRRRAGTPFAEPLENRRLLTSTPTWHATNTNIYDPQNGPMANLGASLIDIYHDYANYVNAGSHGVYTPPAAKTIVFNGLNVGVTVRGTGNFTTFQQSLTAIGMNIQETSAATNTVAGFIPIVDLYRLATSPQINGASPNFRMIANSKGAAINEAETSLGSAAASATYGVNGTGQKIGALSDSVNQFTPPVSATNPNGLGGLAQSQSTGDLPANVTVVEDGPANVAGQAVVSTDEGRAMLEQIYDLAPGAQLSFASPDSGDGSELHFASLIGSLAALGDKTIVDDLTPVDEPAFQVSAITNEINSLVPTGVTYLSSASNSGDGGYNSQFRGVNGTVTGLGAGRYMNFDPTGATQTLTLGVNIAEPSPLALQFDQPLGNVTSNIQMTLLDSSGNIVAQTTSNPYADNAAFATFVDSTGNYQKFAPGLYSIAIKVLSGPDPTRVFAYAFADASVGFDQHFGSAGGTYYEATYGHNSAANVISVGAVPFWGTAPYENNNPTYNETFSSFGPVVSEYNYDGSAQTPTTLLKPDISATDANNTSFFIPGEYVDTSQVIPFGPYTTYPGTTPRTHVTPLTPVNDTQANYPIFTGTSSAAPNLAAVVVLMKQLNPTATNAQILSALTSTASPLDGSAKGVWNPQGGYGLANAPAAFAAISKLQVNSTTPGETATIAVAPTVITVDFSKAVNLATLSAASLTVTGPNGVTVTVGAPVGVDSTTFPTIVQFPIVIHPVGTQIADGIYRITIPVGTIKGEDGTSLAAAFTTTFNLQDVTPPTIVATSFNGRIITATFSEPVNAADVNASSFFLFRAGGVNNPLFNPADVFVSDLPGAVVSYNPATLTATINLTNVAQSLLPTDHYALAATTAIVDYVNNPLNGAFSGVFPSGIANPTPGVGSDFVQDLGVVSVQAPTITSLVLNPTTDSGVLGDSDTNSTAPSFIGQINSSFLSATAGLMVYAQFNGIAHAGVALGGLNLAVGANGRGVVGTYDAVVTTDANGRFVINYPAGVTPLPEGQNIIRAVVVGAPDIAGQAGLASTLSTTFQIDRTEAYVSTVELNGAATTVVAQNSNINNLSSASFYVVDPVNPTSTTSPFAVNAQAKITALNPATADNVLNYSLYLVSTTGSLTDESGFIKAATFVSTSNRVLTSNPLTGRVDLTFASGLPSGNYELIARGPATAPAAGGGITDAAGNSLTDSATDSATGTAKPFTLNFNLQPTPTYITGYTAYSSYTSPTVYGVTSGPRASYEIPAAGVTPGAPAPPTAISIDFSNQLSSATIANIANDVVIARSANSATALPDGDFGNFGTAAGLINPTGYSRVTGVTVTVVNSVAGATVGQYGYLNRVLIQLPTNLAADYYRVYLPNTSTTTGTNSQIIDIYGNQLDGEFQGSQNSAGKYVDQLDTGVIRGSGTNDLPDLSGDGTAGGAFVTGFVVVPNGNIIYARPDAIYNPALPGTYPNGTAANPYPVLAPEATTTALNGGDLNSPINAGVNFDPTYDFSGLGTFQPSAFFAAQEKARLTQAPVVIIAEPALSTRNPLTGVVTQQPFVLQAPNTSTSTVEAATDGSAAVPAMTTLVMAAGSTLKMQNASLLVQNQGSALQIDGGANPGQVVTVTSYKDSSVGGATNGDPTSVPASGDYGGIVFRNYDQAAGENANNITGRATLFPGQIPSSGNPVADDRLKGPFANTTSRTSQVDAVSGADDVMSYIDFLTEKYAGGTVPQANGVATDGITLQNSRPTIINSTVSFAGIAGTDGGAANAGISEDLDSARIDDVAAGPLFRNDTLVSNGINGILLRGNLATGEVEASNATDVGTTVNSFGAARDFVLNAYIPYVLTTSLVVGLDYEVGTQGVTQEPTDRLYITPGSILKFANGSGMEVLPQASLNVGDETYIKNYDAIGASYGPSTAGFKANSAGLAQVIFTSFYDDAATTTYTNPQTGVTTTVTPAISTVPGGSGAALTTATSIPLTSRWSGVTIDSGAVAVINSATFRYGGGAINYPSGTDNGVGSYDFHHALEIGGGGIDSNAGFEFPTPAQGERSAGGAADGAHVMVTNDTFTNNLDVGLNVTAEAFLAADSTRPLASGAPFIHGNIFVGNSLNGVGIAAGTSLPVAGTHESNVNVNTTWTGGDFTYILRDTIVLGPDGGFDGFNGVFGNGVPVPPSATTLTTTPAANVTMTLQSTLAGTVLADGTVVAAPGLPLIVKTLSNGNAPVPAETVGTAPGASTSASWSGGAGFIVGVDDGTDPPTPGEALIDDGAFSQLRILGIGANGTQPRVPVTITSVYDDTIGTTVGTTVMNNVTGTTTAPITYDPTTGQVTAVNGGGVIEFGSNSLDSYNLEDPRSGSTIDNADIKYMTRIEQQGGGIVYTAASPGDTSYTTADPTYADRAGLADANGYATQYNEARSLTISDSNLSYFSDRGVVSQPGFSPIAVNTNYTVTDPITMQKVLDDTTRLSAITGEPTHLFLVNDTITNMQGLNGSQGVGVDIISQTGDDNPGDESAGAMAVILNDTFYNDGLAINSTAPAFDGVNPYSEVSFLAMDSIFANNGTDVVATGDQFGSDLQYNLFYDPNSTNPMMPNVTMGNAQFLTDNFDAIYYLGNPDFRSPSTGDFTLLAGSDAIDHGRQSLNQSVFGNMLLPSDNITQTSTVNGTAFANNINFTPVRNQTGDTVIFGGESDLGNNDTNDLVTLPGAPTSTRVFPDLWVPTLNIAAAGTIVQANSTSPTTLGTTGNGYTAGSTYAYVPIYGPRDQNGTLRGKDPASTNIGTGTTDPFTDLGAFEYVNQNPPVVTGVSATTATGATSNLYAAGSIAGINAYPSQITVAISERLNASTVNANSVLLIGSGGDGIFGNGNDITYSLANRLSFNTTTNSIVINTTGLLPTGTALTDEYELVLKGTGQNIIRDNNSVALDGYTANDTLPLPSGSDDNPGSDFVVNFTIDTSSPSVVTGTFTLAPGTYNTAAATAGAANVGSYVTDNDLPTFVGTISDTAPTANPLAGDKVYVDISTTGDPNNFNLIGVATGTTNANGSFSVTVNQALPNSPWTVGTDGKQGTIDDVRPSLARVRVVNAAGNSSLLTTSPITSFQAAGALLAFEVDTVAPKVTAVTPAGGTLATENAAGQIIVTTTFSKNINPATLNANSVLVYRAGGTGTFTGTGTAVPIVAGSFSIAYLNTTPQGPVQVSFALQAPLPNDFYRIVLKGTGTTPITDIAGNALDGLGTGVAGSGDYTSTPFTVFTQTAARLIYVDGTNTYTEPTTGAPALGSRENPYKTIAAAMAVAETGDDVLVLPGTYREDVTLKGQVRLLSAASSSTDTSFTPGNPLSTIIYGNTTANSTFNSIPGGIVVQASNLTNVPGVPTEIFGFTILAPLIGDSVRGTLDTTSVGIALINSDVLVDRNYIVNAGIGVNVATTGANVVAPQIEDNVIAGNYSGIGISDQGSTTSYIQPTFVINNTIADNTYGIYNSTTKSGVIQGYVINDIFYNNHDTTAARAGTGILSLAADTLLVGNSLFYQNGVSNAAASNASGTFAGFVPSALAATPDSNGNILANPYFVDPQDPRPTGDTAPVFFLYANYDLSSLSPAINAGNNVVAPSTDILYRTAVAIAGKGRTGTGPASIGAFYYLGTGGITATSGTAVSPISTVAKAAVVIPSVPTASAVGGSLALGTRQFDVVNTSLNPNGPVANKATAIAAPASIVVNFSDDVNTSSITASDLKLAGSGLNSTNPARATGLTWVDSHTVKFLLTGGFNATGAVNLSIPAGSIKDSAGDSITAYLESFNLGTAVSTTTPATPVTTTTATPAVTTATPAVVTLPIVPVGVAGPIAVHYTTPAAKAHSAKQAAAATAAAHKKEEAAAKAAATAKHAAAKHAAAAKAKAHKKAK